MILPIFTLALNAVKIQNNCSARMINLFRGHSYHKHYKAISIVLQQLPILPVIHFIYLFPSIWIITKTCLFNFDPLKPHFYIVKLRFTGVYIIFLIFAQNHRLWVLFRTASPRRF